MSRSLEIKELKNGSVRMAREAEVPLIPMIVFGGHRVLSYDVRDFTRGRTICMTIGRPMASSDDVDEMTRALRSTLSELLDETIHRYPDKPPGAPWIPQRHGGSAPSLEEAARIEEQRRVAREPK